MWANGHANHHRWRSRISLVNACELGDRFAVDLLAALNQVTFFHHWRQSGDEIIRRSCSSTHFHPAGYVIGF
jgi:hypothetical protein